MILTLVGMGAVTMALGFIFPFLRKSTNPRPAVFIVEKIIAPGFILGGVTMIVFGLIMFFRH